MSDKQFFISIGMKGNDKKVIILKNPQRLDHFTGKGHISTERMT
jgi:hypothetical protein